MWLRLPCADRVGLVSTVTGILAEHSINIMSIEVEKVLFFWNAKSIAADLQQELIAKLLTVKGYI